VTTRSRRCVPAFGAARIEGPHGLAHLLGRVNATRHVAFFGVMPIGALLGGVLGAAIGLQPTIAGGAVGLLVAPLWIVAGPIRRLSEPPATGTDYG
jgi:hypothetical protein